MLLCEVYEYTTLDNLAALPIVDLSLPADPGVPLLWSLRPDPGESINHTQEAVFPPAIKMLA